MVTSNIDYNKNILKCKKKLIPCGLVACEYHNDCDFYGCNKDSNGYKDCAIYIPDTNSIRSMLIETTSTQTIKKPTLKQIVDIRNLAKYITVEIIVKTKGKFLFKIGLNIMKFGTWITGCNIQLITNDGINTEVK